MNCDEHLYRWTGKALLILLGIWVAGMLGLLALSMWLRPTSKVFPAAFEVVFSALFAAIFVLSVIRIDSYIRWTGKYPYYFLFGEARASGSEREHHKR